MLLLLRYDSYRKQQAATFTFRHFMISTITIVILERVIGFWLHKIVIIQYECVTKFHIIVTLSRAICQCIRNRAVTQSCRIRPDETEQLRCVIRDVRRSRRRLQYDIDRADRRSTPRTRQCPTNDDLDKFAPVGNIRQTTRNNCKLYLIEFSLHFAFQRKKLV